jgi:DNA-3-methyladenine glycosylase II
MPVEGWSLAASVEQFGWAGAVEQRDGETRYCLGFTDEDGLPFAVSITPDEDGVRVRSDVELSRSATFQIARMLSIAWPADDDGFPAIGQRDPAVEALQARYPGVRPIGSPSVFEAAVRVVVAVGLPERLAGVVWRRVADSLGVSVGVEGAQLHAFPTPDRLLDPDALGGLRGMNGARPLIQWKRARIAALAQAAVDGELDGATLRGWDGRLAVEHVTRVAALEASAAELVVVRGAHHPDVLLAHVPQVTGYLERAYRLRPGDGDGAAAIARVWAPYRSWVSALMLCAAQDAG